MGNFISEAFDEVKDLWDDVRDAVGDSSLGAIIGAALFPVIGPAGMGWAASMSGAAAAGGAIGGAYSGGAKGAALGAIGGYGIGSLAQGAFPTYGAAPTTVRPYGDYNTLTSSSPGGSTSGPPGGIGDISVGAPALNNSYNITGNYGNGVPDLLAMNSPPPSLAPDPTYYNIHNAPPVAAPPVKPWWQTGLEGAAIVSPLLSIGEEIDYENIEAPPLPLSPVDQYYADVAKYGEGNVTPPPQLAPPPPSQRHDFGSKRMKRRR